MGCIALFRIGQYIYQKRESKKYEEKNYLRQKEEYRKLLKEREVRTEARIYEEEKFWNWISTNRLKSKDSYKHMMGLIKDQLLTFSAQELILLDNLLNKYYKTYYNKNIVGATQIIFHTTDIHCVYLLMNYLLFKGEVIFKNTCLNEHLINKLEVQEDIAPVTLSDIIHEVYWIKNKQLIPKAKRQKEAIQTINPYDDDDLAALFPDLWLRYS